MGNNEVKMCESHKINTNEDIDKIHYGTDLVIPE